MTWPTMTPGGVDLKSVVMSGPTFAPPTTEAIRSCLRDELAAFHRKYAMRPNHTPLAS